MSNEIPVISNPQDLETFKKGINEIAGSMARIDAERELIKSIKSKLKEDISMPTGETGRVASVRHKRNLEEVEAKADTTISLYEQAFGTRE